MNTSSLLKALDTLFSHSKLPVNYYVTAADTICSTVDFSTFPTAIICNTDPEGMKGKHWLSFYLPQPGVCEYFDSYGMPIYRYWNVDIPEEITEENCKIYQSSFSNVCGQHCIFYLYNRALGISYSDFVSSNYNNSVRHNDTLVRKFVAQIPGLEPCKSYPCHQNVQGCKCRVSCSEFM